MLDMAQNVVQSLNFQTTFLSGVISRSWDVGALPTCPAQLAMTVLPLDNRWMPASNHIQDFQPGETGHLEIDKDQVGPKTLYKLQTPGTVVGGGDFVGLIQQNVSAGLEHDLLIVDDQESRAAFPDLHIVQATPLLADRWRGERPRSEAARQRSLPRLPR